MQRRKFGKLDFDVSLLGFGCMRLPTVAEPDPDSPVGTIDYAKAVEMVRYAVDHGVDYIDTAYSYHDERARSSSAWPYRTGIESGAFATKLPMWKVTCREDCDRFLAEQLTRLQTDHVDMYLLHSLGKDFWRTVKECNVLEFLDQAKADDASSMRAFPSTTI